MAKGKVMLIIAGILFVLAMLSWFVDRMFDNASVDLRWATRILIFLTLIFIALNLISGGID